MLKSSLPGFLAGLAAFWAIIAGVRNLPRRDADQALEVMGERSLVRVAGARSNLRQGEVAADL
jgi:hypothetical protein